MYNELSPVIEKLLIYDTASCRVGKGTDFAISRVERFVRSATDNYSHGAWYAKMDLSGFFMSTDRDLLFNMVLNTIDNYYTGKYKDVLKYLCDIIIRADPTIGARFICPKSKWDNLPKRKTLFGNKFGLPIGNITSQMFQNFYLNNIDHFIKSRHRYYERYVDDMIIIDTDKEKIKETLRIVRQMFPSLNIKFNERKTRIGHVKYGIDFLGIKIKPYYSVLGKKRIGRIYYTSENINNSDKICASANSRKGMFVRYHGYNIARRWYKHILEKFDDVILYDKFKFEKKNRK